MSEVKVFQINEYDAVAAKYEEEAKQFYLKLTGLPENEAFPEEITVVPLDTQVWADETLENKISLSTILESQWSGEPFLALTSEW